MKIYRAVLAAGVMMLVAAGCCQKCPKVAALVAGEEATPVAVVVEYAQAVAADAVTPETFAVPGAEVAFAVVSDKNPACPKECKEGEEKPECCKEGKPECCKGDKPECCKEGEEKPECCAEEKPECCQGEKPECCKEGEEKPECCAEGKPECCKKAKPACCPKEGQFVVIFLKGEKPAELTVQQVQDVAYAAGGAAKAWKKAVPVKNTVAIAPPCHGHHHPCPAGEPAPEEPKAE